MVDTVAGVHTALAQNPVLVVPKRGHVSATILVQRTEERNAQEQRWNPVAVIHINAQVSLCRL